MENLEVILMEVCKEQIDSLIFDEFKIVPSNIRSSHFFDHRTGRDLEYQQINSFKEIFSPIGTGNVVLEKLELGQCIENVVIVFSFDNEYGDIVINFPESEVFGNDNVQIKEKLLKILNYIMVFKKKYSIKTIRIGLEPATDDDTCLIELNENSYDLNKEVLRLIK